jgi:hypothetical protein
MTPLESDRLTTQLAKLFAGQMTSEQRKFTIREFLAFRVSTVETVIVEHRKAHEFLNYPALFRACADAEKEKSLESQSPSEREGSWCDVYRRQNPSLVAAWDVEVILRVHRGWWHRCRQAESYCTKFSDGCKSLLFLAGCQKHGRGNMPADEINAALTWAEQTAALIFADPSTFELAMQDLRGELALSPGGR